MHIMLDLETLGTKPGCIVLSVGAVAFDTVKIKGEYSANISFSDSMKHGFTIEPKTFEWWMHQDCKAIEAWAFGGSPLIDVLKEFSVWLSDFEIDGFWGNGSDFDNAILGEAYDRMIGSRPWPFRANRCFRTVRKIFRIPKARIEGIKHVALDDARAQAKQLMSIQADRYSIL